MVTKNGNSHATLCIDIGGTGIKAMLLGDSGKPSSDRKRVETPQPAKPKAVIDVIEQLAKQCPGFHRVSVGFPGVVRNGVVQTAPNLHPSWQGLDLAKTLQGRLRAPTRVANDADVQGFGAIGGKGVELVITLGTGVGSALFLNGALVPNLETAHHPFRNGRTYEECLGIAALKRVGRRRWNKRVRQAIEELDKMFNYDCLIIGGGNAAQLNPDHLPPNVKLVSNVAGLLGGVALWKQSSKPS